MASVKRRDDTFNFSADMNTPPKVQRTSTPNYINDQVHILPPQVERRLSNILPAGNARSQHATTPSPLPSPSVCQVQNPKALRPVLSPLVSNQNPRSGKDLTFGGFRMRPVAASRVLPRNTNTNVTVKKEVNESTRSFRPPPVIDYTLNDSNEDVLYAGFVRGTKRTPYRFNYADALAIPDRYKVKKEPKEEESFAAADMTAPVNAPPSPPRRSARLSKKESSHEYGQGDVSMAQPEPSPPAFVHATPPPTATRRSSRVLSRHSSSTVTRRMLKTPDVKLDDTWHPSSFVARHPRIHKYIAQPVVFIVIAAALYMGLLLAMNAARSRGWTELTLPGSGLAAGK